eukprot:Amastigsp_a862577_2.p2 type:complete len:126 gc:universal Amastigsp_a862577_2:2-379(+)
MATAQVLTTVSISGESLRRAPLATTAIACGAVVLFGLLLGPLLCAQSAAVLVSFAVLYVLSARALAPSFEPHLHHWASGLLCASTALVSPRFSSTHGQVAFFAGLGFWVEGAARWSHAPLWHRRA